MASGPGISGNLEKSRNFVALEKGQGFLMWNWEKSGNFTCEKWISPKFFFEIHSSGERELVTPVHMLHMLINF